MKRLLLGLTMMLVMNVAIGSAETVPIQFQASGSFIVVGTRIDDGNLVVQQLFITSGTGSQVGLFTNQTIVEWNFGAALCPEGTDSDEGTLVGDGSAFVSRAENGDLLFGAFTSGTNSVDCETGTAQIEGDGVYLGGTGRFAGVTGSFMATATATALLPSGQFGSVVAEGEGTLTK